MKIDTRTRLTSIAAFGIFAIIAAACESSDSAAAAPYNASCLDKIKDSKGSKFVKRVAIDHSELTGGTDTQYTDALYINVLHEVNYPGGSIDKTNSQQDNELRRSLDAAVADVGQHGEWIEIVRYARDGKSNIHDDTTELGRNSDGGATQGLRQFRVDPDTAFCVNIKS